MVIDSMSLFKIRLVDHLKSLEVYVDSKSIKILSNSSGDILIHCGKLVCNENLIQSLKLKSQPLEFKIDCIMAEKNLLIMKLNRLSTFNQCFIELFSTEKLFPIYPVFKDEEVNLIYDTDSSINDLTNFRIDLLVRTVSNLANACGYDVKSDKSGVDGLYFTYKSNMPKSSVNNHKLVLCGSVLNACESTKEKKVTTEEYKKLKKNVLQELKNRDNLNDELNEVLVEAILKFEFLRVKASCPVIIDFSGSETSSAGSAVFVLYNYSRLNAIIHEFENRVKRNYYPAIPSVENVDFSLLKQEKEWTLIFNYVMNFPTVVKESVQYIREGKPSPHMLCSFLLAFARSVSSYYRCTKILLEAKSNLLPLVYARMYLIKSIHRILLAGLELLNVQPVPVL